MESGAAGECESARSGGLVVGVGGLSAAQAHPRMRGCAPKDLSFCRRPLPRRTEADTSRPLRRGGLSAVTPLPERISIRDP